MKHRLSKPSLAALALCAALAAPVAAQMHAPTAMTPAQFQSAATGSAVTIAVRVQSVARNAMQAQLLVQKGESQFAVSGQTVELYKTADTPIVMGSAGDLHPGAVLFVYATATTKSRADVTKIVVITPYAKVE